MYAAYSTDDGVTWDAVVDDTTPLLSPTGGQTSIRDPFLYYEASSGTWWACFTTCGFGNGTTFGVAKSTDGPDGPWSHVVNVDCSAAATSADNRVWSPKYFVDPADSSLHVIVGIAINYGAGPGHFDMFELHPTNAAQTTWSAPVLITGDATFASKNVLDGTLIKEGSTYYLFYKNEDTGQKWVELATSSSPFSGYTVVKTGNQLGLPQNRENITPEKLGPNSFRMWLVDYTGNTKVMYYFDSTDLLSWGAGTEIYMPNMHTLTSVERMP